MLMSSFLGAKIVDHTIACTPVKKEEVPMGRVSLGKGLWKDEDAVNQDYINTPSLTNATVSDLSISIPSHVSALEFNFLAVSESCQSPPPTRLY